MKKLKNILLLSLFSIAMILFSATALQAQNLDRAMVQELIQSKNFVFNAQSVFPMNGPSKQLTSEYEVRFLGDSIVSYLPYFGRAYSAVYPMGGGGVDFTSTQFDYKAVQKKKDRWTIEIDPKDTRDVRQMNLTVYDNGYATLQVTSDNRQSISYNGYIAKRK